MFSRARSRKPFRSTAGFIPKTARTYYTTTPDAPDRPNSVSDGVCCHVFDHPVADAVPLYRWRNGP